MPTSDRSLLVDGRFAGTRLDAFLSGLLEGVSLRARRRMVERGLVLVNGKKAKAGLSLREGDSVRVLEEQVEGDAPKPSLLSFDASYLFLSKPPLLHTVSLAGSAAPSLESALPDLAGEPGAAGARLLQRLDFETSGIVVAARNEDAAFVFRDVELKGGVQKRYLCLLEGALERELALGFRLVSDGGRGVRALDEDDPSPVRSTLVEPLFCFQAKDVPLLCESGPFAVTLAGCTIAKGARHQIRAHLAKAGFALLSDRLYGGRPLSDASPLPFYLHHAKISFLDRSCSLLPPWAQGPLLAPAKRWIES